MRQARKWHIADPSTVIGPAGHRDGSIAAGADGNRARRKEADVSIDIGIHNLLHWCFVMHQRRSEAGPITGAVQRANDDQIGVTRMQLDDSRQARAAEPERIEHVTPLGPAKCCAQIIPRAKEISPAVVAHRP